MIRSKDVKFETRLLKSQIQRKRRSKNVFKIDYAFFYLFI